MSIHGSCCDLKKEEILLVFTYTPICSSCWEASNVIIVMVINKQKQKMTEKGDRKAERHIAGKKVVGR